MNKALPIALIPAYKPEPQIVNIAQSLIASGSLQQVIAVDDGSGQGYSAIFDKLSALGVEVLRHAVNLGKGAALRTGLNHALCRHPEAAGVVTLDADGQHLAEDIVAVAKILVDNPDAMVLGVRGFDASTPFRSRFGNNVTRMVMRVVGGLKISDTQTGLRGIPMKAVHFLLKLRTSGYDYELDMLLKCRHQGIRFIESPIATVYIDNNRSSHFNPFLDSLKIYLVFLRFNLSSLLSVIIDYFIFAVVFAATGSILTGQALARLCAGTVNYFVNRQFVFKSNRGYAVSMALYVFALVLLGTASYGMIQLLHHSVGLNVYLAKVLSETLLYIASFTIQRDFIFTSHLVDEDC